MPAVASSSESEPSEAIAKRDTAPSAKFVVKANRSSGVTTAQQISLRPLPTDEVRGTSEPSTIRYDDAAAAPFSARKASVTTSAPPDVNAKPYGVGPCDGIVWEAPKVPSAATLYVSIESVPRSVITISDPAGLNATCAGSASLEASTCSPSSTGAMLPSACSRND